MNFFCIVAEASSLTSPSLSSVLDIDGSVKPNMIGSFDPNGYRMIYEPNGKPKFVPADERTQSSCNDGWDSSFYANGANNDVKAIVSDGAGNIYVGGDFRIMNTIIANGIAKWDGTSWSALGSGVNGRINAIAIANGSVYVGGSFTSAGGISTNNVAKWDGSSWSAFGSGMGTVLAIAVSGNDVFVGGDFNSGEGYPNYVARWNGSSWTSLGTGMNSTVNALAILGNNLYAGGLFTSAGGVTISGFAKWDGTAWSAVGGGLYERVQSIAVSGTDIYVGGYFSSAGGDTANGIAKWDGTSWSTFGAGVNFGWTVHAIAVSGSEIYIGGTFPTVGGLSANKIARWNGSAWTQMGTGIEGTELSGPVQVNALAVSGSTLFVGGNFNIAGGVNAQRIAKWSAGAWSAFQGTGLNNVVRSVAVSGTDVYVVGSFTTAGNTVVNNVAKWNGSTWSALGSGIPGGFLNAVAVSGNNVYVGGNFSSAGNVPANNIAKWDGNSWSALGDGLTGGNVFAIAVVNSDIYAGGSFVNGGTANHIAKWNGTTWIGLNSAIVNVVTTIVPVDNLLYVGAATTTLDSPNYFLKYDGTTWTPLGNGMTNGGVSSIAVIGSDIYVAGAFNAVGGIPAARIAKYNGSSWSALGSGLPPGIGFSGSSVKITAVGSDIYAVGDFTLASGGPGDRIAKWNGTSWSQLGSGLNATGWAVAASGDSIYAGGDFTTAGCNLSAYFARWRQTLWTGSSNTDWHNSGNWGSGSVPPANAGVTIQANNASITTADVTLGSLVVTAGRTLTIGAGRTLTVTGNLYLGGGNLAGPGNLVVNGDLTLSNADVTNLGSITVNGNLQLNGGKISGSGAVTITSCRMNAVSGGNSSSFISSPLTRCVSPSGSYQFPVGAGTVYSPVELTNVIGSSNFTVAAKAGAYSAPAGGLPNNRLQRWWQLTNGGITQADVALNYTDADVVGDERKYRGYRISGGTATQMPTLLNQSGNRATIQGISGTSAVTLAQSESMPATFTGRTTSNRGNGAFGVLVSLTDDQGEIRYTVTNPAGYYRFLNIPTFRVYTVKVISKRYTFPTSQRTIDFDELSGDINFVSSDH